MAIIGWSLWRWRNDAIFEKEAMSLPLKLEFIARSMDETKLAWGQEPEERDLSYLRICICVDCFVYFVVLAFVASNIHQKI